MRRVIAFSCAGERLIGTLDEAPRSTGLLIVSGGSEVRAGPHRCMALLAARIAARGHPVLRFDRRGVGDSSGVASGYASSGPDLQAAAAALRREQPQVTRIVGFGNCSGASALALFGCMAEIDTVVLANPWVVEAGDVPPAAAVRRRYAQRLMQPSAWWRMMSGRIDFRLLAKGLRRIAIPESRELADGIVAAIAGWRENARVVLASEDATAVAFADTARRLKLRTRTTFIATASHSFARAGDAGALETAIRSVLTDPR